MDFITKPTTIKISEFKKNRHSLCPKDYRIFGMPQKNIVILKDMLIQKPIIGQEIGSSAYLKESDYRFLKTNNIQKEFTLVDSQYEFCIPNLGRKPINDSIFIVKDGGGDGLGEVCFYSNNCNYERDYISSGILNIKLEDKYIYYVLGYLKQKHFKKFVDLNTPEGSTIRHSKKVALEYPIVIPDDDRVVHLSKVVKNIINKENNIIFKNNQNSNFIDSEFKNNSLYKKTNVSIELIKNNVFRLDAGMYSDEYLKLDSIIKNYKNGYFCIPINKIKSGSTPKQRYFLDDGQYRWVTPTNISDEGYFRKEFDINTPIKNNLNKDALLFINRTSKGGKGEYVGISAFYDYSYYGKGHHNQGIYRVEDFNKEELLFMVAFMNSTFMRKMSSKVSYGTKMRELKSIDLSKIKFPNFPIEIKDLLIKNYYNESLKNRKIKYELDDEEEKYNSLTGIFQLENELEVLKEYLSQEIRKIIIDKI